jgi:hypothetical protein
MSNDNHRTCSIYFLYSSRNIFEIKYIGQTTTSLQKRLSSHIKVSKKSKTKKDCWIQQELNDGFTVSIGLLEENAIWDSSEIEIIKKFKSYDLELVNTLSGGSGSRDYPQELKDKISAISKNLWSDENYRKKQSELKLGVSWSKARRESHNAKTPEEKTESGKKSILKMTKEQITNRSKVASKALWEQKRLNGTDKGVHCNSAKLNDTLVYEMRVKHKSGISFAEIARQYGVSRKGASKAITGETWSHVKFP